MSSEHKKLALALGLLAVAAGVYLITRPREIALAGAVPFVCVETGEVFELAPDDVPASFPAPNPKTGRRTLLPAHKNEQGRYVLQKRYAQDLSRPDSELAKVNKHVDPKTLELTGTTR